MTKSTAGAVLLLILAAGGLINGEPLGYVSAAFAAMLAFLTEEARDFESVLHQPMLATILALASWIAVGISFLSLAF